MASMVWLQLLMVYSGTSFVRTAIAAGAFNASVDAEDELRTLFQPKCTDISFWMYSSERPEGWEISPSLLSVWATRIKPGVPLKVLIHGFTGNKDSAPNDVLRPVYLRARQVVLSVDYEPRARSPRYLSARLSLWKVTKCTATLLNRLVRWRRLELRDVHVLGFSLGAHVAGNLFQYLRVGRLPRVTALDPAGPLFRFPGASQLSTASADLVDVFHTNPGFAGLLGPAGHVDVYFNYGIHQPGCPLDLFVCDHNRSVQYFAESVTSARAFEAFRCPSLATFLLTLCKPEPGQVVRVGEHIQRGIRGRFYVYTRPTKPFHVDVRAVRAAGNASTASRKLPPLGPSRCFNQIYNKY